MTNRLSRRLLVPRFMIHKLVLTEGRFVEADGWDISGDVALLSKAWLERLEAGGRVNLTLTWESR